MTDSAPFWMCRLKVGRARHLINEVKAELERYRLDPPIEHKIVQEPDGGFVAETTILCGPVEAAPIIGDLIHNLRASLDIMAVELATITSGSGKNVYFPFADASANLDEQVKRKNFHKAGNDAVDLLKTFRPYKGGNNALRTLHDLDIEDKHIALVPTHQQLETKVTVPFRDGLLLPDEASVTHNPGSLKLVFPDDSAFAGDDVVETLENLVELVDGIIEAFASLFALRATGP